MDNWEIQVPQKEERYSSFDIQHISAADYKHSKRVWKGFAINNLCNYRDLYVQSEAL